MLCLSSQKVTAVQKKHFFSLYGMFGGSFSTFALRRPRHVSMIGPINEAAWPRSAFKSVSQSTDMGQANAQAYQYFVFRHPLLRWFFTNKGSSSFLYERTRNANVVLEGFPRFRPLHSGRLSLNCFSSSTDRHCATVFRIQTCQASRFDARP